MSWAIWIAGRSGSEMLLIARAAATRLAAAGSPVVVLELDQMRAVVTPHPTNSEREEDIVHRALVFAAVSLTEAGVPVIIAAPGHRREWRDLARVAIKRFAEVHVAGARAPEAGVPGTVADEPALSPELSLDTDSEKVQTATGHVAALGLAFGPVTARPHADGGAVIWLTGPPGSGKTTLAVHLAGRLGSEGMAVTILEWVTLRGLMLNVPWVVERDEDIAYRALAYTAKRLADAGVVVVVDATAPRRMWREVARDLIDDFAEIQLVCSIDVCRDRERAVRWRPHPGPATLTPDLGMEYEYSLNPDLLINTETRSEWTAAEDLVSFARRLVMRTSGR